MLLSGMEKELDFHFHVGEGPRYTWPCEVGGYPLGREGGAWFCFEKKGSFTPAFNRLIKWNQFSSVTLSCPTLNDPMDCSTPGLPVQHQLPGFTQTHVHQVSDAIQTSHPLSFSSLPAFNLSQHHLFRWVSSSYQVTKVLEFQLQHQSFQWIFRFISFRIGWLGLAVQGNLKVFSSTTVWRHQFFGAQPSLWYNVHIHTWLLEKP